MSNEIPVQPTPPLALSSTTEPSFAEALTRIANWTDLSDARRRDLASGLRAAARLAQLPLSEMRCCPEFLNTVLFERPAAAAGMSEQRRRDVLSLVRAVLRRLGRHRAHEAGEQGLGEAWRGFMAVLPDSPRRAGLRGFARWCDRQQIFPVQVVDTTLAEFVHEDAATRIAASALGQGSSLAAAWRWAVALQPNPTRFAQITAPARRVAYTLPISAYPDSFGASIDAFAARISGGGGAGPAIAGRPGGRFQAAVQNPFRGAARSFRPLKPASVASRLFSIRQAAAALHITGTPVDEIRNLRDLVHPIERAGRILDFFDERAGGKPGGQLMQIAETLRQIGCSHVEIPETDRAQLSAWVKAAQGRRRGEMGPKARACIQQFTDPRNRGRLLHLPARLALDAKQPGLPPQEAARLIRSALLIDLLTTCPLRIGDVQPLRLAEHFACLDGDRHTPSHLHVPDGSSKTGEPISWPLAASTRKLLRGWIAQHRSKLHPDAGPFLFPGEGGGALSMSALRMAFQDTIARRLGLDVYPHAARHLAAYIFLQANPGQYELARRILGHRSVETTVRFYCGLETDAAARAFDDVVARERAATRMLAVGAGRGANAKSARRRVA